MTSGRLRRQALLGCWVLVTVALVSCTGDTASTVQRHTPTASSAGSASSTTTPSADGSQKGASAADFEAVGRVLTARAQAISSGDRRMFVKTLDPTRADFVDDQLTYFRNLQVLPVGRVSYEMQPYALTPAKIPGADRVLSPDVSEHVFLPGPDQHPVGSEVGYTFVKRGNGWLLGADSSGPSGNSSAADSRPWAGGPVAVAQRGPLLVVMDSSAAPSVDGLADDVMADIRSVARFLHVPADMHLLVDATSTGSATRVDQLGTGDAAAVTYPVMATKENETTGVAGWRVKINPDNVTEMLQQPGLLRHELAHFLLRRINIGDPTWLVEGVADVAGYWPTQFDDQVVSDAYYKRLMAAPRKLPETPYWSNDPDVNYQVARAAVDHLVLTYGVDRLVRFMRAFNRLPGTTGDEHTKALLGKIYGTSEAAVVRGAFRLLAQFHH